MGASSSGEFTEKAFCKGGVSALAIGGGKARQCVAAMGDLGSDVPAAIAGLTGQLAAQLGTALRDLDPKRYVGVVLIDSIRGKEEAVNEALGNVAPFLSFVGGSAGDNLGFKKTWVYRNGESSEDGVALAVLELEVPFTVLKTCHFDPTEKELLVTRADPSRRLVMEFDGRPAAEVYAEAVGTSVDGLGFPVFLANPVGIMIDGKPWLRSICRVEAGNSLWFGCAMGEGMRVKLMKARDLLAETRLAIQGAAATLGRPIGGALMFDCVYRMLEMEARKIERPYHDVLSGFPLAGAHTHGESWLGHINQTLTGLIFG